MSNELAQETSPYLLQHANNPVHWKAWRPEIFNMAQQQHQLIIVSIGYSTCHWCHVMEHESFEDEKVAKVMNQNFIAVKVDREERPDVDAIYMKAVQLMTGRGGWPLNVVCLPDGKPVWGGTYFKKEAWIATLKQLQELYTNQPEKMLDYAEKLHAGIAQFGLVTTQPNLEAFRLETLEALVAKWEKSFDWEFGGYARAPKFMMPNNSLFLLHYAHLSKNEKLLDYVNLTLTKMAYGGIFDTIAGGFSRYAVDVKWHIPHFEKMAYDNGQLLSLYAAAFKATKNPLYQEVIQKTISFVEREWLNEKGGFYSALDADSINPQNQLEEGAFYVWTTSELQQLLKADFALFSQVFNINEMGHWENENYVLLQTETLVDIAKQNNLKPEELQHKKKQWERLLFEERTKRPQPRLDDKCITSWNAILTKGLLDSYQALGDENYLTLALKNTQFVLNHLLSESGGLFHTYKNEKATINGFLEDYAFVIDTLIVLYETTLEEKWLVQAKTLTHYCLDHFYDSKQRFFRFTSNQDPALIANHFELEDNVIPASNSVMANNLFRLSRFFDLPYFETLAEQMTAQIIASIDYPSAFSNWLAVSLNFSSYQQEVALCGENFKTFSKAINQRYYPNILLAGCNHKSDLPILKNRYSGAKDLLYVCQHKSCLAPMEDLETVFSALNN